MVKDIEDLAVVFLPEGLRPVNPEFRKAVEVIEAYNRQLPIHNVTTSWNKLREKVSSTFNRVIMNSLPH